ncbi:MAG: hypothetical protein IT428_31520 [Planctomycetaceae bacterium]|nr:hypothetical protein [Planctomycetaceae bacterium]
MLAALLRGLIGGAASRGAMGGGAGGLLKSFMGGAGKKGADGGGNQPGPGAAATKPQVNYSNLMGQMGNPNAYQQEKDRQGFERYQQQKQEEHRKSFGGQADSLAQSSIEAAKGLADIVTSTTGVKDQFEGVSKLLSGDVLGGLKSFATGIVKSVTAIVTLPLALKAWGESLLESRRELSRYDAKSSVAFARADASKTMLDIRSSQVRGDSTAKLADAIREVREELRPLEDAIVIAVNHLARIAVNSHQVLLLGYKNLSNLEIVKEELKKRPEFKLPLEQLMERFNPKPGAPGFKAGQQRPPLPPLR